MEAYFIVSVIFLTYNQEQWIAQTIESVMAQQTTYPFEVIIGDDCSTDGTRAICDSYVSKFDNIHLMSYPKNQGLIGNWVACVKAASGKYIMNCAGDDYWHNPNKIQLQVDLWRSILIVSFLIQTMIDFWLKQIR